MPDQNGKKRIMIVGNCASGKSTLSRGLRLLGYDAQGFSQEHSYSPRIWRRRCPDILIVLECSFAAIKERRQISWGEKSYQRQLEILADAKSHADLWVQTDAMLPGELVKNVHEFLQTHRIPADGIDNA